MFYHKYSLCNVMGAYINLFSSCKRALAFISSEHSFSISGPYGDLCVEGKRHHNYARLHAFWGERGPLSPIRSGDVGSWTCPGMALPVHGTSIYSLMRTAPYSILSMSSAWQGSSMYHFQGDWYHPARDLNPWPRRPTTHKASTLSISHRC